MAKTRTRVDSAQSKTKAKRAASKPLPMPTGKLDEAQLKQYKAICGEFARVELTTHKVELIAKLARSMVAHDEQEELLQNEGPISSGAQGGDILNPRVTYVNQLAQRIIQLRRSLGIHSGAGKMANTRKTRDHNKENEKLPEHSSLIKRPSSPPDLKAVA